MLHPQICDFVRICKFYSPNTLIRIVTNSIKLLDMTEEFWKCCKENSIVIGITQYPIDIDYEECIEKIKLYGIDYESFSGEGCPRDEMWRLSLDKSAANRPVENFISCPRANACIFVSHGKIYNCATMANINHYNKCFGTNFALCEEDYVDIYKISSAQEIFDKLCKPKPFCRFCNIERRKYGMKWEKTSLSPEEWM